MTAALATTATGHQTRATALSSAARVSASLLAHDPIAATANAPLHTLGREALWRTGARISAAAGPMHCGQLWIAWHRVQAGENFATAELHGLRFGPLYVRSLIAAWVAGDSLVQIDASVNGHTLQPGSCWSTSGLEIRVGLGLTSIGTDRMLTGLVISAPDEPVLRLAVVGAEPVPESDARTRKGPRP